MSTVFRRNHEKNDTNLIVINQECQICASAAKPVGCSKCYTLLCEDCIGYFEGKPICSLCRDEIGESEASGQSSNVLRWCNSAPRLASNSPPLSIAAEHEFVSARHASTA